MRLAGATASTTPFAPRRSGRPRFILHDGPPLRERRHPHRSRGQQDPEGHRSSRAARSPASTRRTCLAGTATACRSRCRSRRRTARTFRSSRDAAALPRVRDRADRDARRRTSSGSACSATGIIRTRRWTTANEADEIRTLGKLLEKGYLYRGLKPVNWCFDCGSALAEAEVEYEDRVDIAIDVGFPLIDAARAREARGVRSVSRAPLGGTGRCAVDLDDDAVDDPVQPGAERPSGSRVRARRDAARAPAARAGSCRRVLSRATSLAGAVVATATGAALERIRVPPSVLRPARRRSISASTCTLEQGTGHRPQLACATASTTSCRAAATG